MAIYSAFGKKGRILVLVFVLSMLLFPVPVQAESRSPGSVYHSKSTVIQMYKDLCDAHKDVASYEAIGKSIEGRDIWLFKVGNPNGGKVMVDGSTHGSEDAGTELSYLFLKWVLESGEEDAIKVLNGNYFLVIPIINMDTTARQNMRRQYVFPNGTVINCPYGVDLNRNGVTGWGQSGSGDPYDDYSYRGAWAGSEPETQAYRNAMNKYRPDIYVNTHFGGEYMLNRDPSEKSGMREKVLELYDKIRAERGVTYRYSLSGGLRGGFVANDGWGFGASGWLVEFASWENVPAEYDTFVSDWYPRAFPLYLAWCKAVQIDVRTRISISLTTSTPYDGFKVEINGNLTCNKAGIPEAPVLLSYSINGGESWDNITLVNTAHDGGYSTEWMPSALGNYLVKATWLVKDAYPETTSIVNLAVTPFKGQNVFSVESNSSISKLAFNATNWTLGFTASGPNGTRGYAKVTVAKSLVANITNIRVFLDGGHSDYSIVSLDESWLLTFDYIHDTHQVEVDLGTPMEGDTTPPTVSILSPENKTYTTSSVSLSFTVEESTSWIGYSLDEQTNVTITGNTTLSGLSDGSHSLIVYSKDTAGNTGASEIIYFSTKTQEAAPFPIWIVATMVTIAIVGATLLIYFTKAHAQ